MTGDTLEIRASLHGDSTTCELELTAAAISYRVDDETYPLEPTSWAYTVIDKLPPFPRYDGPAGGQPIDAPLVVEFDEAVIGVSLSSVVVETGGSPVAGSVSLVARTVSFTPASPFTPGTTYTLTLTTAITDLAGNPLASGYSEGSFDPPEPSAYVFTVETAP